MNSADPAHSWVVWPVVLLTALASVLVPWLLGGLDMDMRPVLKVILTAGVLVFVICQWRGTASAATNAALVLAVTVVLAAAWWAIGAMAAPGFLLLFAVPVCASALMSRGWLEYLTAALAIGSAAIVTMLSSRPVAWLLSETFSLPLRAPPGQSYSAWLGETATVDAINQLVLLAQFSIAMIAVALIVGGFSREFRRRQRELLDMRRAHEDSRALTEQLLEVGETPLALVERDSGALISFNTGFAAAAGPTATSGRRVIELLDSPYPELLENAMHANTPQRLFAVPCRLRGQPGLIDVEWAPDVHQGQRVARLKLALTAEPALLAAALDEASHAMALLGPGARVGFASAAFRALFPVAVQGAAARDCLDRQFGLPDGWWDIAPSLRTELRFDNGGDRVTAVIRTVGKIPEFALTLIELRSGGRA